MLPSLILDQYGLKPTSALSDISAATRKRQLCSQFQTKINTKILKNLSEKRGQMEEIFRILWNDGWKFGRLKYV